MAFMHEATIAGMGWYWYIISGICWNISSTTWGLFPTPQEVWKTWRSTGKTWRSKRKAWKAKTKQQNWTSCGTYCPSTLKTAQIQNDEIASKLKIISDAADQNTHMCFYKCSQKWIFHLPCVGIGFGVQNESLPPLSFIRKVTIINDRNIDFDQIRVWWFYFPLTFCWTCSSQSFTFTLPVDCEGNFAVEAFTKTASNVCGCYSDKNCNFANDLICTSNPN